MRKLLSFLLLTLLTFTCSRTKEEWKTRSIYQIVTDRFAKTEETTEKYIPRDTLRRVSTPQAYKYGKLVWAYKKAFEEKIGIGNSSYTNTMMVDLGETLYFAAGSDRNIKLTTKDNLEIFKAYLKLEKDEWLK